jgi:hypothetical protein
VLLPVVRWFIGKMAYDHFSDIDFVAAGKKHGS